MEKNIIQKLIDAGIITEQDIDDYNRQKATGVIANRVKTNKQQANHSKIKDGVLVKFDERDLVDGKYVVPSDVTEIAEKAFYWSKIKEVIIHDGIKQIKYATFAQCENLESVILPDSVEEIHMDAFVGCEFEHIDLPKNLKIICNNAFYGTKLKEIEFPDSVEQIGCDAFNSNKQLTKISLPSSLKIVRQGAFANCTRLQEVVIPEGVESIREGAFINCINLERVYLPQSLKAIDRNAFTCCSKLNINANWLDMETNWPSNIRYLDWSAFSNTPIEKVAREFARKNKIAQYPGQVFEDSKTK